MMLSLQSGSVLDAALESAARSLLAAGVVWAGLRAFRIRSVPAQKVVWGLVLAAAVAMPLLMPLAARWRVLPMGATVILPRSALRVFAPENPLRQMKSPSRAEAFEAPANAPALPDAATMKASAPFAPVDNVGNHIQDEASFPAEVPFTAPDAREVAKTESAESMTPATRKPAQKVPRPLSLLELTWLLYASVAAGLLLRMVYGLACAVRLWRGAEPVQVDALRGDGGLRVRTSRAVASPVTIGSGIVLPADYADWDAEKLRIVLAHERSHLEQRDFYLQLLAGLYAIAFWFSPLGWWLKRRLSDLAEAISDRAGLCEAASRSAYAQVLLEFAAKPRPTHLGVAMARQGSLSRRIDRVLNDSAFQQAFAASRLRVATAVLLVPAAVFAATTLIRVQAAAQTAQPAPQSAPAAQSAPAVEGQSAPTATPAPDAAPATVPVTGQSTPPDAPILVAPSAPVAPDAKNGEIQVVVPPMPPIHVVVPKTVIVMPKMAPLPPMPEMKIVVPKTAIVMPPMPKMPKVVIRMPELARLDVLRVAGPGFFALAGPNVMVTKNGAYYYQYSTNGDSFVLVKRNGQNQVFSGAWADGHQEEIAKAGKLAHGDFLWFTRKGKSYFIDDPAIVSSVEASMDAIRAQQKELGRQQQALGRQQEALGRQQGALAKQQLAHHMAQANMKTPEMNEAIAKVQAALAELKAKQGSTMTTQEWARIEGELGELQARLGEMRAAAGSRQGETGSQMGEFGAKMGEFGAQQGELGAKQGKLGERQAQLALQLQTKVNSIIDESVQNGKAHPVQ